MAIEANFISVGAIGQQVTTGATTASVAIPVNAAGALPKHVRVQSDGFCYIRFGQSGVAATVNDLYLTANNPEIVAVSGCGFMAYLQGTVGAKINITPLES